MNKTHRKSLAAYGPVMFIEGSRSDRLVNLHGVSAATVVTTRGYGHALAAAVNDVLKVQRVTHHPKKRTAREKTLEQMLERAAEHLECAVILVKGLDSMAAEEDIDSECKFIADIRELIGSTAKPFEMERVPPARKQKARELA